VCVCCHEAASPKPTWTVSVHLFGIQDMILGPLLGSYTQDLALLKPIGPIDPVGMQNRTFGPYLAAIQRNLAGRTSQCSLDMRGCISSATRSTWIFSEYERPPSPRARAPPPPRKAPQLLAGGWRHTCRLFASLLAARQGRSQST
jgi:hypothetical protein